MNWLLKKLGFRERRNYRGPDFTVSIETGFREIVYVIHERGGTRLRLDAERIGKKWVGISINIPDAIDPLQAVQVARDLEIAFQSLGHGYIIARLAGTEIVSEAEQQAALTELSEMGFKVELSPDRKQIRQQWKKGAARPGIETAQKEAPRMMALAQALHGKRQRLEILARSPEFGGPPVVIEPKSAV